jgi:hypothetical protein
MAARVDGISFVDDQYGDPPSSPSTWRAICPYAEYARIIRARKHVFHPTASSATSPTSWRSAQVNAACSAGHRAAGPEHWDGSLLGEIDRRDLPFSTEDVRKAVAACAPRSTTASVVASASG